MGTQPRLTQLPPRGGRGAPCSRGGPGAPDGRAPSLPPLRPGGEAQAPGVPQPPEPQGLLAVREQCGSAFVSIVLVSVCDTRLCTCVQAHRQVLMRTGACRLGEECPAPGGGDWPKREGPLGGPKRREPEWPCPGAAAASCGSSSWHAFAGSQRAEPLAHGPSVSFPADWVPTARALPER